MSCIKRKVSLIVFAALVPVALMTVVAPVAAQDAPQRWRGRVIAVGGGPVSGQTAHLTLQADQWTSDATMKRLATTLIEKGQQALLKEVASLPSAGWITIAGGLRYDMRTMRSQDLPDGTRVIRSVTDRPIQFGEMARSTRSRDYAFGIVELYLTGDGTGQGRLIPAAQIEFEHGQVEITSFGTMPFAITKVAPEKVKAKKN
jgi:hypothetical protein